jgi:hypothetical protein
MLGLFSSMYWAMNLMGSSGLEIQICNLLNGNLLFAAKLVERGQESRHELLVEVLANRQLFWEDVRLFFGEIGNVFLCNRC